MARADNKTAKRSASPDAFLTGIENDRRREDCREVAALMAEITGEPAKMWGPTIIGFGEYHYVYDSGREGDMFLTGVSPRKQALTVYIMGGFERHEKLLAKLGKYRTGKACLYINKLDDVHRPTLKRLISASVKHMRKKYNV